MREGRFLLSTTESQMGRKRTFFDDILFIMIEQCLQPSNRESQMVGLLIIGNGGSVSANIAFLPELSCAALQSIKKIQAIKLGLAMTKQKRRSCQIFVS